MRHLGYPSPNPNRDPNPNPNPEQVPVLLLVLIALLAVGRRLAIHARLRAFAMERRRYTGDIVKIQGSYRGGTGEI